MVETGASTARTTWTNDAANRLTSRGAAQKRRHSPFLQLRLPRLGGRVLAHLAAGVQDDAVVDQDFLDGGADVEQGVKLLGFAGLDAVGGVLLDADDAGRPGVLGDQLPLGLGDVVGPEPQPQFDHVIAVLGIFRGDIGSGGLSLLFSHRMLRE